MRCEPTPRTSTATAPARDTRPVTETREAALLLLRLEIAVQTALLAARRDAARVGADLAELRRLRAEITADLAGAAKSAAAMRRRAATRRTGP